MSNYYSHGGFPVQKLFKIKSFPQKNIILESAHLYCVYSSQLECLAGVECPLMCHLGHCVITEQGPQCECPPMYDGKHCEHYLCSQHCKNNGVCFADLLSAGPDNAHPPLVVRFCDQL